MYSVLQMLFLTIENEYTYIVYLIDKSFPSIILFI